MIFFRVLLLVGLIRLLIETNKPLVCAEIYAAAAALGALMSGRGVAGALIAAGFGLVLSGLYFWLLDRFDGSFLWWVILVAGLAIGLV